MAQSSFVHTNSGHDTSLGYDMATHNGQAYSPQPLTMETNNVSPIVTVNNTGINNPVPHYQFQQKKQGEFRFWLSSNNFQQIKFTTNEFNQFPIQQQAAIVFNQQFSNTSEVITFMHECIKRKMIWTPNCNALNNSNQFTSQFISYCNNWLHIMYSVLLYIRDEKVDNQVLCELEAAAVGKLNQLHHKQQLQQQPKNLQWDDTSLIMDPFPTKTDAQGHELDITIKSSQQSHYNKIQQQHQSTAQQLNRNVKQYINESKEMEIQQQNLQKLEEVLRKIETVYKNLDIQVKKIEDNNTRKDIQQEIEHQIKLVNQHITRTLYYKKQLPEPSVLQHESVQAKQLAENQQHISDTIIQCRITQAQQFLRSHQQLHQNKNTIINTHNHNIQASTITTTSNVRSTSTMNAANGHLPAVAPIQLGIGVKNITNANKTASTTTNALADPTTYTQYSRNLYDNRNGQWKDKEEYKDDKNENERIKLKFTGKEEDLKQAAMTFIKNIQMEAETLIARGVFSEPLFVNHIIYKCLQDKAYNDFSDAKKTKLLPINPTKVSEIIDYLITKYQLVDYIKKVKKEFENFQPARYPWLEIVSEFENVYQQYCIVTKACGLEGQYDTDFSDKYLVNMIKDKLPKDLRQYIKQIRWETKQRSQESNQVKLPEATTLLELQELIEKAKEKYNYDNDDPPTQQPIIEHGFKMNATQQQRDRSRYPPPQYPKSGKPNFTPTTTPRGYEKQGRGKGGRKRGRGRGRYRNVNYNNMQTPYIYIPPTNVKQNEKVRYRDRPPFWHGVCTDCGVPGHHEQSCKELQQYRSTILNYARRFFRAVAEGKQSRAPRINAIKQQESSSTNQVPQHTGEHPTPQEETATFFTPQ